MSCSHQHQDIGRPAFWLALPLVFCVHVYRFLISPVLHLLAPGCGCRFYPSCSAYALEALKSHGLFKGSWLAAKRLAKCHPWGSHGFDPVPPSRHNPLHSNTHFHG